MKKTKWCQPNNEKDVTKATHSNVHARYEVKPEAYAIQKPTNREVQLRLQFISLKPLATAKKKSVRHIDLVNQRKGTPPERP